MTSRPNPFALSLCGRFVVERQEGDRYPNVMAVAEAAERQARNERDGARYEAEADTFHGQGRLFDAGLSRGFAAHSLTVAADLAEVLAGAQQKVAA